MTTEKSTEPAKKRGRIAINSSSDVPCGAVSIHLPDDPIIQGAGKLPEDVEYCLVACCETKAEELRTNPILAGLLVSTWLRLRVEHPEPAEEQEAQRIATAAINKAKDLSQ